MKKLDVRFWLSFAFNIAIVILEIVGLIVCIGVMGTRMFIYYTQISNLLLLVSALVYVVYCVLRICGVSELKHWVCVLKYVATCGVSVTFLVVLFVLIPTSEDWVYLIVGDSMLYHHTLCPILAIVSFFGFEKLNLKLKDTLFALITVILYSIPILILVANNVIEAPYFFMDVNKLTWYQNVLCGVLSYSFAYLFCWLVYLIKTKTQKRFIEKIKNN